MTNERTELLLELILAELRILNGTHKARSEWETALQAAIEAEFAPSPFTVKSLLSVVDDQPEGVLAQAVAAMPDIPASGRARSIAIGARLARMRWLRSSGEQRGSALYRLAADVCGTDPQIA